MSGSSAEQTTEMERHGAPDRGAMIRLERLSKRYPGQDEPAVAELTLSVPTGEIVVLVGPSGCGKTTTLKMINRLIEPSSGRIFLEGEDVTTMNPDRLRRRMGYVIQQIGLFPHMTIADNIATVPKMLKWDDRRTRDRVDELLDLMGLDPAGYRDRYPKELSGGQRQRVGVARALAADPPVMLMDEPFGAVDPITRVRLQNEFLRLQEEIDKTIVFVTHDIDEAVRMGDRIAILRVGGHIAQYDTPETILTAPADDFVSDFIGKGASLKRLNLSRVRDVELAERPTAPLGTDREELGRLVTAADDGAVLLLDAGERPRVWVDPETLRRAGPPAETGFPAQAIVEPQATLHDALDEMLVSDVGCAIVVDGQGAYQGIVDIETIMAAIQSMRREGRDRADETARDGSARHHTVVDGDGEVSD
jgi:osmoprotectant transport system ATP-binding protein